MMTEAIDILLVEDNPDDVELTRRALKKGKVANNLYIVRDGEEALDFLFHKGEYADKKKYHIPGLILLDINLPKRNGIEVLQKIKTEPILKRIPVIMLTTSKRDEDIIQSYDLGVNSYIMKPVEFDKFIQTIKNIELYWILTNTPPLLNGRQRKEG